MSAHEAQNNTQGQELPHAQLGSDMHPVLQKIVDNVKYLAIAAGAVILIVGGYGLFEYIQKKRVQAATAQLGEILVTEEGDERVKALEAFVQQAPSDMELAARFELAAALQGVDRYEEALAVWQQLEGEVPQDMQAAVQLGKANAMAESGKAEEALSTLQAYLPNAPESYKGEVQRRIAIVAEDMGKTETAMEAYRAMIETENLPEQTRTFYLYKISNLEQKADKS